MVIKADADTRWIRLYSSNSLDICLQQAEWKGVPLMIQESTIYRDVFVTAVNELGCSLPETVWHPMPLYRIAAVGGLVAIMGSVAAVFRIAERFLIPKP